MARRIESTTRSGEVMLARSAASTSARARDAGAGLTAMDSISRSMIPET
jgi:hypothetical protein